MVVVVVDDDNKVVGVVVVVVVVIQLELVAVFCSNIFPDVNVGNVVTSYGSMAVVNRFVVVAVVADNGDVDDDDDDVRFANVDDC